MEEGTSACGGVSGGGDVSLWRGEWRDEWRGEWWGEWRRGPPQQLVKGCMAGTEGDLGVRDEVIAGGVGDVRLSSKCLRDAFGCRRCGDIQPR